MAGLSPCNPLQCVLSRQINDRINFCKRLIDSRLNRSDNLFRKDLLSHYGCVNAIEFSRQGDLIVSGGDDRRVLLWKVEQAIQGLGKPLAMKAQHGSNIFCLGYDSSNTKIFSAGNDDQVIVHDLKTGDPLEYFLHEKPVYGLSIHPDNDNVFSSACDDGRVLIFDIRESSSNEPFCLAKYKTPFHSVMFNPVEPRKLATANAEEGVSMWDVRKPLEPLLHYGFEGATQSCMNVRFNSAGTRLLALKRRLPPVLYAVDSPTLLCHFDQPGYYNSCTMKSCCFAGDDESYVLSGSDDFNLYMWKIPDDDTNWVDSAHMILRGHRSIVNHVRYNPRHSILASSGVEKIIKVWSPFSLGNSCLGGLSRSAGKLEKQRRVYTHDEYIRLVIRSGQFMTHDYSHQSTREDPRMMAFFDSLVQREIEGWSTEDAPITQPSPSESENTSATGQNHSATDSDDSTASDAHLMRSVLWSKTRTRDASGGGVAPERPFASPNRITRLIGNCRDKLMRLAALENGALAKQSSLRTINDSESENPNDDDDDDHDNNEGTSGRSKSKSKSRSKAVKRKTRASGGKCRVRRKITKLKLPSETESEVIVQAKSPSIGAESEVLLPSSVIDTTQPSTSTGVTSRKSQSNRYPRIINSLDSDRVLIERSSESSEEETPKKRRRTKAEPESASRHRRRPERCKNIMNSEANEVNHNHIDVTRIEVPISVTPLKENKAPAPPTSDSGITSGISTVEKCSAVATCNGAESSDHERALKNLECLRKKVDVARRSYRKRSVAQSVSATDSSD